MPDAIVLSEFAGIGMPDWVDALIRLVFIVALMTINALALIYLERKVLARFQARVGPTRTGPVGILQSAADALKLLTKEDVRPHSADRWVFELAVFFVFVPVFLMFIPIPFTETWFIRDLELGFLYVFAVLGLNIVGVIMAGWGSDNKYALLGGARAAAQLISYEVPLILSVVAVVMFGGSLNLGELVDAQGRVPFIVWQPLAFFIFAVAGLAELYRNPFDIPVAESEVVGGPFVEYSGIRWSMFQLSEYLSLVLISVLGSTIFLGGWNWPLGNEVGIGLQIVWTAIKTSLFVLVFFLARASLPRLRIDQLMAFAWQVLIPFAFLQMILNGFVLVYDLPDWTLGVMSGAATIAAAYLTYRRGRRVIASPYSPRYQTVRSVS